MIKVELENNPVGAMQCCECGSNDGRPLVVMESFIGNDAYMWVCKSCVGKLIMNLVEAAV